jgi:hypothetical protein
MQASLVALALSLLVSACGGEARELDERIPASPGGLLEVDVEVGEGLRPDPGSLTVVSHDADEVWVVADASGWGSSAVAFRLDRAEGIVRLYGRVRGAFSWLFGGPNIEVRIWVPREFSLDLRCSACPITIEDVRGPVRARTRGGSIDLVGSEGSVRLRADGGEVRVSEVLGDVDVKASDGAVTVSWVTGDVEARTESGEISIKHIEGNVVARADEGEIELREIGGAVDAKTEQGAVFASFVGDPQGLLETRRGSVEVHVPDGAGSELDARSGHGSVILSSQLQLRGVQEENRAVGLLNGGGPALRLYTARGTIRLVGR